MFEVGFLEIVVIAVVSLLVLGPERLPVAIRHIGLWVGRFRRSYRQIRAEIEREIGADDIRRQLHNEEIMQNLNASREEMDKLRQDFTDSLNPKDDNAQR